MGGGGGVGGGGDFSCKLCCTNCSSAKQLSEHSNGRKHKEQEQEQQQQEKLNKAETVRRLASLFDFDSPTPAAPAAAPDADDLLTVWRSNELLWLWAQSAKHAEGAETESDTAWTVVARKEKARPRASAARPASNPPPLPPPPLFDYDEHGLSADNEYTAAKKMNPKKSGAGRCAGG